MALEAVNDEVNFLIGPPIASLLVVQGLLWGPVAAAALLSVIGLLAVLSKRSWEPALHAPDAAGMAGAIRENGLLIVSAAGIGSILGASQVLLLGYCTAIGAAAGIALALRLRSRPAPASVNHPESGLVGRHGVLLPREPGGLRVRIGDSDWPARLPRDVKVPDGEIRVRVEGVAGTTLVVRPDA
jgi:membrane protein implicated in regulation of membrane protease activity